MNEDQDKDRDRKRFVELLDEAVEATEDLPDGPAVRGHETFRRLTRHVPVVGRPWAVGFALGAMRVGNRWNGWPPLLESLTETRPDYGVPVGIGGRRAWSFSAARNYWLKWGNDTYPRRDDAPDSPGETP